MSRISHIHQLEERIANLERYCRSLRTSIEDIHSTMCEMHNEHEQLALAIYEAARRIMKTMPLYMIEEPEELDNLEERP